MNLRCLFHVLSLEGVHVETAGGALDFHPAPAPTLEQLQALAILASRKCPWCVGGQTKVFEDLAGDALVSDGGDDLASAAAGQDVKLKNAPEQVGH